MIHTTKRFSQVNTRDGHSRTFGALRVLASSAGRGLLPGDAGLGAGPARRGGRLAARLALLGGPPDGPDGGRAALLRLNESDKIFKILHHLQ